MAKVWQPAEDNKVLCAWRPDKDPLDYSEIAVKQEGAVLRLAWFYRGQPSEYLMLDFHGEYRLCEEVEVEHVHTAQEFFSELLFRTKGTTSGADFMQEAYGVAQDMGLEEVPTEEEPPDRESEGLDDLSDADIEELGGFVEDLDRVMP
jgi:hypothetical protein